MRRALRPRVPRVITIGVVVILALGIAITWRLWNSSADASGSSANTSKPSTGFYLDIGASTSLGFQPTGIPAHNGKRTDTGYANDVEAFLAKRGINLVLRQVGCPGETAVTMLLTTDHCYKPPGRQLFAAEKYLEKEGDADGLVTIDLGFNDVRACMLHAQVDEACANKGLAEVRKTFPRYWST